MVLTLITHTRSEVARSQISRVALCALLYTERPSYRTQYHVDFGCLGVRHVSISVSWCDPVGIN